MKVTMQQSIAGHADPRYDLADFSFAPGEIVDMNDELAGYWIAAGIAAPYKERKARSANPETVAQETN
jgi:hypothetical protein